MITCSLLLGHPSWSIAQQTSNNPDWRACNPFSEIEQTANPVFVLPLEVSQGLIVGRSASTPYTFSLQLAAMYAPLRHTRRLKIGPTVALTYPNPDVQFLAGLRLSYRAVRLPLQGTDLGVGVDGYVEGAWESPDAGLVSAGIVGDASIFQLLGRVTYDFTRGESRWMLGLGIPLTQSYGAAPRRVEDDASRWRFARSEFLIAVRTGISEIRPDSTLLCDYTALRQLTDMVPQLNRDASSLTLDGLVDRFRVEGLLMFVARLERQPQRWRDNAVAAKNQKPLVSESAAVEALVEGLRRYLYEEHDIRSDP